MKLKNKLEQKYIKFAFLSILLFSIGCVKKDDFDFNRLADNQQIEEEWASALVNAHLTIDKLVNDTSAIVQVNPTNGFITLVFQSADLWSKRAEELLILPNQSLNISNNSINLLSISTGQIDSVSYSSPVTFVTPSAGQRIDSVFFKSGAFNLNLSSNINHQGLIKFNIPSLTKNGVPFSQQINYPGIMPVPINLSFDLTGYTLKPNNVLPNQNTVMVNYKIVYQGDNNVNNSPYSVQFTNNLTNLGFSKMFGYMGQLTFNAQDTFNISIYENNYTSFFDLVDIKAKLYTWNSFGTPVNINVNQLYGTSTVNPPYQINVTSTLYNPLNVPYPSLLQFGQTIENISELNSSNSNIQQLIGISPRKFIFNITGTTNPTANQSIPNFVLDTSRVGAKIQVEFPLYGKIKGFTYQDTAEFSYNNLDEIESVLLRINTINGFPLDAHLQIYCVDTNYVIKDSLLNPFQQIVYSGICGPAPDFHVQTPTANITDILLDENRLHRLVGVKHLLIRASLWSYNYTNQDVKVYMDNYLDLKLGAKVKFKYNIHR